MPFKLYPLHSFIIFLGRVHAYDNSIVVSVLSLEKILATRYMNLNGAKVIGD